MGNKQNPFNYTYSCKYCGSYPAVEGPHHDEDCPRYRVKMDFNSELAFESPCIYCGALPFVAGKHHKKDCPRCIDKDTIL